MSSSIFHVQTHVVPCQHIREYPAATSDDQEATLQLHVKQYIPQDESNLQPGAITIIGAHANGFPKELYEPLWEELYLTLKGTGLSVRSIWIADVAHQGMSSVLNEDYLGNDRKIASWYDHARDLLHMINHFRKDIHRPIVGIGHSMGGCHLVNLSLIHPRLLSTLVLIDPVIQPNNAATFPANLTITQLSTFRRDIWPSRAEAAASFQKNPFYQSWDPRVLNLWIEHGLRNLPTAIYPTSPYPASSQPPVTLTTTKHQEVFTFLRPQFDSLDPAGNPIPNCHPHPETTNSPSTTHHPFTRPEPATTFLNLPHLRPSALYIFGGQSNLSPPDMRAEKLVATGTGIGGSGGAKAGRVKEIVFEHVGHLIPMETVNACARAAADWLVPEMRRWGEVERGFEDVWGGRGKVEKVVVCEEWKRRVGGDPRSKPLKL